MKRQWVILLLATTIALCGPAYGQTWDRTQTGIARSASYFHGGIDSIHLANGNLFLDIPLISLPGRELGTGLRLTYNSQKKSYVWPYGPVTGWQIGDAIGELPIYQVNQRDDCWQDESGWWEMWALTVRWTDGSGTSHVYEALQPVNVEPVDEWCGWEYAPSFNDWWIPALDAGGSWLWTGSSPTDARIYFVDGSVVEFSATPTVRTANGNYLVRDGSGHILTDTLGRTIQFETNKNEPQAAYWKRFTVVGGNGQPQTYQLNYEDGHMVWAPNWGQWMPADDWLLSIDLPDGRSYGFEYNHDRGYLTKVTLPSGATISYDYYPSGGYDPYRVLNRTLSDGQTNQLWNFSLGGGNVTVTDPIGNREVHLFTYGGLVSETRWEDSVGTIHRTVLTTWTDEGNSYWGRIRPVPTQVITRQGSHEKRVNLYINSSGVMTGREESGWTTPGGSATTLRWEGCIFDSWTSAPSLCTAMERNPTTGQLEEKVRKAFYYDELSLIETPSSVPNKGSPPDPYHRYNPTSVRTINPQNPGEYVTETFRYDDLGNLREITGPLGQGHTTVINFTDNFSAGGDRNSVAYPTSVTNAAGHQAFTQYHYETGLVTQTTDPRGLQSSFTYDGLNRPIGSISPNGLATAVTYDDINRFVRDTATVGANLHKVETYFDKFYRTFKIVGYDPAGNVQADTLYDASGRVSAVSEPYRTGSPAWTSTAYDAVDRPVTVTKPDGSVFQYSYPYAYSINETDEAGNGKVTSFATTGEIDGVNDGILTTTYQHSMFGPLSVHQDGQWRTFTYDWLGRQASASHPESGTTSYGYDVAGRMTSRTDARGVTSWTSYDVIDRPLVTCYSDATPTVTRTYDQNGYVGFLTTIVDGTGTTTFTYNSAGQLASESRTFNGVSGTFTTSYGYDLDGKLQSITYPSGRVVAYSYQSGGGLATSRLNSIVDQSMDRTIVNNVEDNAAGQITSQTLGNGVVETRSFNNRSQLTGIAATHGGSGLLNLSFGYGNPAQNDGRIRSRTDALQSEHSVQYTFDSGGRLTQAINDSWSVGWGYDVWGNRLSQSPTGLATSRVGSQTLGYFNNRNASFSYDAAGNVANDTVHNYAYDGESRMVQGDGGAIVYGYDFAGRRVQKTVAGQTTYYLYGLGGLMSEFTTANTAATGWSANDRTRYIVSEQTGTPVLAMAQDGLVEENNRVFPFGESWLWETGTPFDPQFTSYLRDDETGLDYAMARNYASRGGRFVTSDPGHVGANLAGPQSWNAYVYGLNDPINGIDPSGASPVLFDSSGICSFYGGSVMGAVLDGEQWLTQCSIGDLPAFLSPDGLRYDFSVGAAMLEDYNWRLENTHAAITANAALQAGNTTTANEIMNTRNANAGSDVLFKAEVCTSRDAVVCLGVYTGWAGIRQSSVSQSANSPNGFTFDITNRRLLESTLRANPLFYEGNQGALHVRDTGRPNRDFRSTVECCGFSLQIVNGPLRGYVDIDRFNPYESTLAHFAIEVLPGFIGKLFK